MTDQNPTNYADGTVVTITMGASEFDTIVRSASSLNQLVLLEFSALWCGPCKMLAPLLGNFAVEHKNKLVVCKMDCEQTAANRDFAAQHAISAFPTLKLYRGSLVVDTIRGANPPAIRQSIQKQLSLLDTGSGSGGAASSSGASVASSLARSLATVKASCSTYEEFLSAAKALLIYASNILDHPQELKYRQIKKSNAAFQSRLGSRAGGMECMRVLGFKERIEGVDPVLVMDDVHPELAMAISLLRQAIEEGNSNETDRDDGGGMSSREGARGPGLSAEALAQALGALAVTSPTAASGAGQQPVRRQLRVTPGMLAVILERAMIESGVASGNERK